MVFFKVASTLAILSESSLAITIVALSILPLEELCVRFSVRCCTCNSCHHPTESGSLTLTQIDPILELDSLHISREKDGGDSSFVVIFKGKSVFFSSKK